MINHELVAAYLKQIKIDVDLMLKKPSKQNIKDSIKLIQSDLKGLSKEVEEEAK